MSNPMYFNNYSLLLWGAALTMGFICGIAYLSRGLEKKNYNDKLLLLGIGIVYIFLHISLIFTLLAQFENPGYYIGHVFFRITNDATPLKAFLEFCSDLIMIFGCILFILAFELAIKKTKYLLSIFNSCLFASLIISGTLNVYIMYRTISSIFSYLIIFIILTILFYLTKWSQPEFKTTFSFITFGILLFIFGSFLNNNTVKDLNIIPLEISPLFIIIGNLFCLFPIIINPNYFSKNLKFWSIGGCITIIIIGLVSFYVYINTLMLEWLMGGFLFIVLLSIFYYITIHNIKSNIEFAYKNAPINVLGMFSRPQRISEEEISISKEKKICLVCKGEILGINFICRECKAFYCEKCYYALSEIENACWACESALDKSKPVNLPEKKEEDRSKKEIDHKKPSGPKLN